MATIGKLTSIANGALKAGEVIKARTAGNTVIQTAGGESVDGFIGATDHNVIILAYSLFSKKRLKSIPYSQAAVPVLNEAANSMSIVLPGEIFTLTDLLEEPNPKDLVKFIKDKKSADKTTFEATNLTVPAKK